MKHFSDLVELFPTKTIFKLGFSWFCLRKSVNCKMHFNIFIKNTRSIRKQFMWLLMCCFYKLVKFICLLYSMKFELNMRVNHCGRSELCLIYKGNGKGQENEKSWLFELKSPSVKCVITLGSKHDFEASFAKRFDAFVFVCDYLEYCFAIQNAAVWKSLQGYRQFTILDVESAPFDMSRGGGKIAVRGLDRLPWWKYIVIWGIQKAPSFVSLPMQFWVKPLVI